LWFGQQTPACFMIVRTAFRKRIWMEANVSSVRFAAMP